MNHLHTQFLIINSLNSSHLNNKLYRKSNSSRRRRRRRKKKQKVKKRMMEKKKTKDTIVNSQADKLLTRFN
jgi:hypothetical protein